VPSNRLLGGVKIDWRGQCSRRRSTFTIHHLNLTKFTHYSLDCWSFASENA
jgi:hypothetical protein